MVGVGLIDSKTYSPGEFTTNLPYFPFYEADRFDYFWAAKIIARFTPQHLRAIVEEARLSDPRAINYLTRVLVERKRRNVRYWFGKVTPLVTWRAPQTRGGPGPYWTALALTVRPGDRPLSQSCASGGLVNCSA